MSGEPLMTESGQTAVERVHKTAGPRDLYTTEYSIWL
jgi:hypothetical protein